MEGIMMRGPEKACLAVRKADGTIYTEEEPVKRYKWQKIPLVRGVCSLVVSLSSGYRYLMKSAELSMDDEQVKPDKFDLWVEKHFGEKGAKVITTVAAFLGVALALLLFIYLPALLTGLLDKAVPLGYWKAVIEGVIKAALFIGYVAVVGCMSDIHRVFCYHGAEHKTIACYEAGEALTPENARRHTRFHPRCGTSFLLITVLLSILVGGLLPWGNMLVRVLCKLAVLPVIMGVSYEIIQFCGRHDNWLTRAVSAPGLWLQRLTTKEPDDGMLEVAIAAVTPVLPAKPEDAAW